MADVIPRIPTETVMMRTETAFDASVIEGPELKRLPSTWPRTDRLDDIKGTVEIKYIGSSLPYQWPARSGGPDSAGGWVINHYWQVSYYK